MKYFENQQATRLLLDKVGKRSYSVEGKGRVTAAGKPLNIVAVEDDDVKLPGLAAAIKAGVLKEVDAPKTADRKTAPAAAKTGDDDAAAKQAAEEKAAAEKAAADKAAADKAAAEKEAAGKAEAEKADKNKGNKGGNK